MLDGELVQKQKKIIEKKNAEINQLVQGIADYKEQLIKKQNIITEIGERIVELEDDMDILRASLEAASRTSIDVQKMEAELWCTLISQGKLEATADKIVGQFLERFGPDKKENHYKDNFVKESDNTCPHYRIEYQVKTRSYVCPDCGFESFDEDK